MENVLFCALPQQYHQYHNRTSAVMTTAWPNHSGNFYISGSWHNCRLWMNCLQIFFFIPRATFLPCTQCEEGTSEVHRSLRTGCKVGWALWPAVHRVREQHQCVYVHRLDRWPRLACVPAGHGQSQSMLPADRQQDNLKGQKSGLLMRVRWQEAQSRRQHCAASCLSWIPGSNHFEKFLKDSELCAHTADRIILTELVCVSDSRNWRN